MENGNSTGAGTSRVKLKVDDLGAIPNLLDKIDIEKIAAKHSSWEDVLLEVYETKLYQRISANVIARLLLVLWIEKREKENGSKATERKAAFPTRSGTRNP